MDDDGFPDGNFGVLVYGSLLDPDALGALFTGLDERAVPVRVEGYRRVLDATADRRETVGNRRGVCNLHTDGGWTNAVLVTGVSPREFGVYARRETGYRFELVERELTPYDGSLDRPDEVLVAVDAPRSAEVRPIPGYLRTCLAGAAAWGERFHDDFLPSTETADGRPLGAYLGV